MDNMNISQQLNTEIIKLKENDYTSYQKFYGETSQYIYGIIWQNVQDKELADKILNDVYAEIYAKIGTELSDNNQFYAWAGNKAKNISTTYVVSNKNEEEKKNNKAAVIMTASNIGNIAASSASGVPGGNVPVGIENATGGNTSVGIGNATGGNTSVGIGNATGGNTSVGIGNATGGNTSAGMGNATGGNTSAGMGNATGGNASSGYGNVVDVAGKGAKKGISTAVKVAIGVAAVAVVGTVAILIAKKDDDNSSVTTEYLADDLTDDATTSTDLVTTEFSADTDNMDMYAAYYEHVSNLNAVIHYGGDSLIDGFANFEIVDVTGDGVEELIIFEHDYDGGFTTDIDGKNICTIYRYENGQLSYMDEIQLDSSYHGNFFYTVDTSSDVAVIWMGYNRGGGEAELICKYEYANGEMESTKVYSASWRVYNEYYQLDGEDLDEATYSSQRDADLAGLEIYYLTSESDRYGVSVYDYTTSYSKIIKTLENKHEKLRSLGNMVGDNTFMESDDLSTITIRGNSSNSMNVVLESGSNIFHEKYSINDYYNLANPDHYQDPSNYVSQDGNTLYFKHVEMPFDVVEHEEETYFSYIDGILMPVGEKFIIYEDDSEYSSYYAWMTLEDCMVVDPAKDGFVNHQVTESEFNSNGNELMNR